MCADMWCTDVHVALYPLAGASATFNNKQMHFIEGYSE